MKEYKVIVAYCTQRDYFVDNLTIKAANAHVAKAAASGLVWINEHAGKDRYIKIVDIAVEEKEDQK